MRYLAVVSLIFEALLCSLNTGFSASLTIQWDPSPDPDVAAYQLYYGSESLVYTNVVLAGSQTTATVDNLADGVTYYFSATSLSSVGIESPFSGELFYQMPGTPCQISITGLDQVYDGTPKSVSVATAPSDLQYSLTYSGLSSPPTESGYYLVNAVSFDGRCGAQAMAVLTISPGNATVELQNLQQDYDGTPRAIAALTDPPDLPMIITYNGSLTPPTNAGVYPVSATIVDNNYSGGADGFLVVNKAPAQIYLAALDQSYNGAPPQIWTLTSPPGLALSITYNGMPEPPIDAGAYQVDATIDDPNFFGGSTVNMVIGKAEIPIQLADLNQVYDGAPKMVSATTPLGNAVDITYNGDPNPPVQAGTYAISATILDNNYQGAAAGTLLIAKAHAAINFSDLVQAYDGTPKSPSASTDPGGLYVLLKYLGQQGAPSAPGTYVVIGIVYDPNFQGSAATRFTITDSSVSPPITGSPELPPTAARRPLVLSWSNSLNGVTVWSSTNLVNWTPLTNRVESSGSFPIQPTWGPRFFKATDGAGASVKVPISLD